ncbi:MAG: hypothetical protein ACKN86_13215 [Crocinitomicaceae bacterium]
MKKIFFSTFIFCSSYSLFSQKYSEDLEKSYTKTELKKLSSEDLILLEYALNNGFYITALPSKESSDIKKLNVTTEIKKFTDLGLRIENQNQYFNIVGTDKMLVMKSKYVLQNELNNKNN